jgi:Uma2 family endonuclease
MAMTAVPITLDEYMNTSYSPDCEYIDGVIVERNVGRGKHAYTQLKLGIKLTEQTQPKKLVVLVEQRVRISATRVRIPDVCVVEELEDVVTKPPLLCVEVFSPDDRWNRVIASVGDYQEMGVPCVWVVDPFQAKAWIFESERAPMEVQDGRLTAQALGVEIKLADVLP